MTKHAVHICCCCMQPVTQSWQHWGIVLVISYNAPLLLPCSIVNGALNYQIYARPSYEIIGLLLEDPMDRECAAVEVCHVSCAVQHACNA
jgi:hypothetical protein